MWITVSGFYGSGYRPLVLTLPGEQPLPDGDFVTIWNQTDKDRSLVLRTTKMSSLTEYEDWVTTAMADGPGVKVFQQGPALPFSFDVVQASGGHTNTVFTVKESSGAQRVMRWRAGMASWATLVPATGSGPTRARRMFVDPYRPQLIYVLDDDHVWRSDDGGARWVIDTSLETVLTLDGFSFTQRGNDVVLRDMAFDPTGPYRFAVGPRGVFHTLDGITWSHLALSTALAAQPSNLFYDPGRRPCDRSLYVSTSARGVLRLHPLPPEWDDPLGSVVATTGRITLLRVHDVATGFGPPDDRARRRGDRAGRHRARQGVRVPPPGRHRRGQGASPARPAPGGVHGQPAGPPGVPANRLPNRTNHPSHPNLRRPPMALLNANGKLTLLRVHDVGTKYGPPTDLIDVECVFQLDRTGAKSFGFKLREDTNRPAHQGMLDLLRDAFTHGHTVNVDHEIAAGKLNGVAIRIWLTR